MTPSGTGGNGSSGDTRLQRIKKIKLVGSYKDQVDARWRDRIRNQIATLEASFIEKEAAARKASSGLTSGLLQNIDLQTGHRLADARAEGCPDEVGDSSTVRFMLSWQLLNDIIEVKYDRKDEEGERKFENSSSQNICHHRSATSVRATAVRKLQVGTSHGIAAP